MRYFKGLRWFWITVVLAALATTCGRRDTHPQTVIEKYCSLDAQGANFSASNPNAKAIFDLLINEDEAGYDESVIVKSYKIGKSKVGEQKADVDVIYDVLGTIGGELQTEQIPHTETVTFHLAFVENSWKIDGLRIRPHISQSWMIEHLTRNLREDEQAKQSDPRLKTAIAEITNWK